jgi:hypothetical protein
MTWTCVCGNENSDNETKCEKCGKSNVKTKEELSQFTVVSSGPTTRKPKDDDDD